ncbi:DNA polymerase, beta domain protein region [Desulforamulus reducens MI-1]|uniref:DNA polymerase, beta domain protein region n=1 Tax=Desulforamulus reducens (strain ATCC BAA-1160 / DSM 100696 / MI-1) TaxID=349161 RepID=A4J1W6_DESRM|nr:nucleotidyltransferase domain-containing protein [Desulforamulus reducens]ABO49069.1 DNA polymerase, beta domain protein region [Desulforamulus reducens MI-1]
MDKNITMPAQVAEAIQEFSDRVKSQLQDNLIEIRLYGSTARGMYTPDSDIDILVVVKDKSNKVWHAIHDIAFDVGFERDLLLSVIVDSEEEQRYPLFQETLFYKNLQKEGIVL